MFTIGSVVGLTSGVSDGFGPVVQSNVSASWEIQRVLLENRLMLLCVDAQNRYLSELLQRLSTNHLGNTELHNQNTLVYIESHNGESFGCIPKMIRSVVGFCNCYHNRHVLVAEFGLK